MVECTKWLQVIIIIIVRYIIQRMSWSLVDYEYLLDRDDIVIINIKTKEINLEYNNHKYYLENIKIFWGY